MSKIAINFEENFYQFKTSYFSSKFTFNNFFFINLDSNDKKLIDSVNSLDIMYGCNNFCLFTMKFVGDINIFSQLKQKFNLNFIDFSVNCFWIMVFKKGKICEKISMDFNTLTFEEEDLYLEYKSLENINTKLNNFSNNFENYKNNLLIKSLVDVKKLKDNLNDCYGDLSNAYQENKKNIDLIAGSDIDHITSLLKVNQDIIERVDILQDEKIEYENELSESKAKNDILLEQIKENTIKLDKIENKYKSFVLKTKIKENAYKNRDIALFLHINNYELWEEIYNFLKNLNHVEQDIDLYLNFEVKTEKEYKTILKLRRSILQISFFENVYFTYSRGVGKNMGGFIESYLKMIDLEFSYKSIIKVHTKENKKWLFALLYSLIGSKNIIDNNLKLLNNKKIGMIGYGKTDILECMTNKSNNYRFLGEYLNFFNIELKDNNNFIPGGIFWIKTNVIKKYFTKEKLKYLYKNLEKPEIEDNIDSIERLFGILITTQDKIIHGVD